MLHSKSQVSSSASLVQGASLLKTAAGNTEKTAQLLERLKVLVGGPCVCVFVCHENIIRARFRHESSMSSKHACIHGTMVKTYDLLPPC